MPKLEKDFIVLGMYEVHMASAAIMINGKAIAAAHEERFTRIKNDVGFPLNAAKYCMEAAGVNPEDIDVVALSNDFFDKNGLANLLFKRPAIYSIEDWIEENSKYWYPKLVEGKMIETYFDLMGGQSKVEPQHYDISELDFNLPMQELGRRFNAIRKQTVEELLGISKDKVVLLPHYFCHHYHAFYSSDFRNDDVIVVHQEGDGGKYNSGVSIPTEKGLKWLGGTNQSDLGRLYQWTTLLMGMKPYHHEYKIMGLAPYATDYEVRKTAKVFEKMFKLDIENLSIVYDKKPSDLFFYFRDALQGHRFDGIAGALQNLVENHLSDWLSMVIQETGRHTVCYGGGVAMNVKANGMLARLPEVRDVFVPVSPGDETNVFGVCYWITEQHFVGQGIDPREIPPLNSIYLGPEPDQKNLDQAIDKFSIKQSGFEVKEKTRARDIADLLSKGFIVASMQGRSEYGQRSLGNRSILANPTMSGVVDKINTQIKYRDFWMPFCPTMLKDYADKCLSNPKGISSKFMTMSFPINENYKDELQGVVHSGDLTARPQILEKNHNPEYFDLIQNFSEKTGVGCLLNTSFNLHGEPIVGQPEDAIHTLIESELDAVWINDTLISRTKTI